MKFSLSTSIFLLTFAVLIFFVGYWFGAKSQAIPTIHEQKIDNASKQDFTPSTVAKNPWAIDKEKYNDSLIESNLTLTEPEKINNSDETLPSVLDRIGENAGILELLDFLVFISRSEEPGDINYFSETIDLLRAQLQDNPDNIQILLERFVSADAESDAIYYITSLLQSAEIDDTESLFNQLAENLALDGTSQSNKKLLHLIANTNLELENDNTADYIIDIAMFEKEDTATKLFALDLLQPYQLNQNQKVGIIEDLKSLLQNSASEDQGLMIENILRFSNSTQKQEIANQYLADTYALETRVSVINSLTEGTVSPSQAMKNVLFNIAQNPQDPLSEHAKHALLFAFNISNDEYNRLQNKDGN